jgi:hypothetical protein
MSVGGRRRVSYRGFDQRSRERRVPKTITLKLTQDEAEILVDAMEADLEGYVEAAKEARGNNNRADVQTFTEAAQRIQALLGKVQALLE